MAGGRDIFEVEGILDQRMRRGRTEYLIRWMGFDEDEDTWEPEKNLIGCEEILEQWKTRWLAAQTPRRSKIVKPIFKPPPTPPSSRRRTTKQVVQKVETKTETPRRTPRSTPKAKITPTPKIKVTTVNDSEEETSVVVKVAQAATSNSAARAEQREEAVKVAENIADKTVTATKTATATVEKQKVVQKVAAQEPVAETTPSRKVRVTTVISSDNESDHDLKRSALPSRDLSRQVYSQTRTTTRSGVTESSVTSRSGVTESSITSRSGVTEGSGVMTRAAAAHEGTPVSTKLTRQPLDSVRDGRVGLFAEARSKVAVRVGKVQRLLTCNNLLNLVFVACMGIVFYTIFFIRK